MLGRYTTGAYAHDPQAVCRVDTLPDDLRGMKSARILAHPPAGASLLVIEVFASTTALGYQDSNLD